MWSSFFLVAGLLLVASNAAALEGSNFSLSEYFPGTNYTKLQHKLSAAQARSLSWSMSARGWKAIESSRPAPMS